eukprot:scaffold22960_cov58-Phaeocystis_antarctica.AAC.3
MPRDTPNDSPRLSSRWRPTTSSRATGTTASLHAAQRPTKSGRRAHERPGGSPMPRARTQIIAIAPAASPPPALAAWTRPNPAPSPPATAAAAARP